MASDLDDAITYAKDFFEEQEDIVGATATVTRDAIANFDAVSEIPEDSAGWNWGVIEAVLKTTIQVAVRTIPQLRGIVLIYEVSKQDVGKAVEWVEKGAKKAKEFGLDPAKIVSDGKVKPPSVKDLKNSAVKARDGIQTWELETTEYLKQMRKYYTETYLPGLASSASSSPQRKLKQVIVDVLGPIPEFKADQLKGVGVAFEVNLYREVYSKGASIYVSGSPNRNLPKKENVRGIPSPILDRLKKLLNVSSDAQVVASWGLPRSYEACNSCHSPSRMNPKTPLGTDNSDWLIGTGGGGRFKNLNDPRRDPALVNWINANSN